MAVAISLAPAVLLEFVTEAPVMVVIPAGMVISYAAATASPRRRTSSPEARRREHDGATVTLLASTQEALAMPAATAPSTSVVPVNPVQFGTSIAMVPTTFVTVTDPGGNVVFEAAGEAVVDTPPETPPETPAEMPPETPA
ncbi:unnamed protein product [Polarella glacialis]|uniref:Uncharacterized protein n=1 Tax=Polarella glacialis TaxID=89957 RepID=A0A813FAH7_POLGL|nr:unnamed protein product [Polarella glacialis]